MDIKTTLVGSDNGIIYKIDTVEHEGALWLVPRWVEVINPAGQEPARAIRLSGLDFETSPLPDVDYFLKRPIPKAILHGTDLPAPEDGLVVVDRPHDSRIAKKN